MEAASVGAKGACAGDGRAWRQFPCLPRRTRNSSRRPVCCERRAALRARPCRPLLDGNMARVLDRVFKPRRLVDSRYDPRLQALARLVVRSREPARVNWAILDIAARYCSSRLPACEECPLKNRCTFAMTVG